MKDKNKKRELCHHSFFTSHYNRIKNLLPSQLTIQLKLMLHNFSAKTFRAILLNYPNRSIRMVLSSLLSNFRLIFFLCDTLVEFDKKITSFWFVFFSLWCECLLKRIWIDTRKTLACIDAYFWISVLALIFILLNAHMCRAHKYTRNTQLNSEFMH